MSRFMAMLYILFALASARIEQPVQAINPPYPEIYGTVEHR